MPGIPMVQPASAEANAAAAAVVSDPTLPAVLAASRRPGEHLRTRTIVVCLDGTGDRFDNDNSNVVNLYSTLVKSDHGQPTLYQAGIGTYSGAGSLKSGFSAASDMAVGSGLGLHVRDAYLFLMRTYRAGDKICIFGFSRGAYTARCLAAMLHKVGLLPPHNEAQLPFAYSMYKDDTPNGWRLSADFKRTFSSDVPITFLGLWDTVASVGFVPRSLPFGKDENESVAYVRHALALDERRAKFKAVQWYQRQWDADHELTKQEKAHRRRSTSLSRVSMGDASFAGALLQERLEEEEREQERQRAETAGTEAAERLQTPSASGVAGTASAQDLEALASAASSRRPSPPERRPTYFVAEPEGVEAGDSFDDVDSSLGSKRPGSIGKSNGSAATTTKERRKSLPLFRRSASSDKDATNGTTGGTRNDSPHSPPTTRMKKSEKQDLLRKDFERREAEYFGPGKDKTDVLEVWFAGAHADVGGGAVANEERHKLSNISLRWMIRQTFLCNTGILYHSEALAEFGIDVHTLFPVVVERPVPLFGPTPSCLDKWAQGQLPPLQNRRQSVRASVRGHGARSGSAQNGRERVDSKADATMQSLFSNPDPFSRACDGGDGVPAGGRANGTVKMATSSATKPGVVEGGDVEVLTEHDEDYFDAMAGIHDQLKQAKGWWILEVWPVKRRVQSTQDGLWRKQVCMNLGRPRTIRDDVPLLHYTVKLRMDALGYRIDNDVSENATFQFVV